jgi:hypothetical protein
VDDILLFDNDSLREMNCIKVILDTYCKATETEVNMNKSCTLFNGLDEVMEGLITQIKMFSMNSGPIDNGVKYLGFHLNPNYYKLVDWLWLFINIEARITCWCHRLLSRRGRLVLVKSVLESVLVYWFSISHIPKGILDKMRRKCFRSVWMGKRKAEGIPIVKWIGTTKPKEAGGWGLRNIYSFG